VKTSRKADKESNILTVATEHEECEEWFTARLTTTTRALENCIQFRLK